LTATLVGQFAAFPALNLKTRLNGKPICGIFGGGID